MEQTQGVSKEEGVAADEWPMPTGLPDIPLKKLSAVDRWEAAAIRATMLS